jgi:hypothetical protein
MLEARRWSARLRAPGGGDRPKLEDQTHAKQIAYAPQPAMRGSDQERKPMPVTRDAERPLPDARRNVAGCTEGKKTRSNMDAIRQKPLPSAERFRDW